MQNATLHNEDYIKGIGGDGESCARAATSASATPSIDPARRRRHPAGGRRGASTSGRKTPSPISFPKKCPCPLHTDVVREETAAGEEGARARCTGEFACPFQKIEHLKLFVSRRAFDIEGLGEKQIELFFEKGWVKEPADIFTLEERNKKIKLEEIEGYGETSVRNLFDAIEARREISLERFIYALGIRHVGETTALALARGYGSWQAFHDACLKVAKGDEETMRRDGCARPDRRHRDRGDQGLFRREPQSRHRRAADEAGRRSSTPRSRRPTRRSPARPWCSPARWKR